MRSLPVVATVTPAGVPERKAGATAIQKARAAVAEDHAHQDIIASNFPGSEKRIGSCHPILFHKK